MDVLVWILALVLVFSGIVLAIRHKMFWGIGFILMGIMMGVGAGTLVN